MKTPAGKQLRLPPFKLTKLPSIEIETPLGAQQLNMGMLAGKVAWLARYFEKVFPKPGQSIGIAYPVSPMLLVILFALLKAGKSPCILAPRKRDLSEADWSAIINEPSVAAAIHIFVCDKNSGLAHVQSPEVDICRLEWDMQALGCLTGEGDEVGGDCACPVLTENMVAFLDQLCRHAQNPGSLPRLEIKRQVDQKASEPARQDATPLHANGQSTNAEVPLVSVILPVYNHCRLLPLAIDSVLAQTESRFELIVVNDGSTDGTREYLDGLTDPRIRVIHQENRRLPGALNTGFKNARGKYCTWVSADNYAAPMFLEALVGALEKNPDAGWAVSAFAWINERSEIQGVHRDQDLSVSSLLKSNPGIASFLYRRSVAERIGLYNEALEGAEDWDFWLRMAEISKAVYVPEILYYYRLHADSMTEKKRDLIQTSSRRVIADFLKRHNDQLDMAVVFPGLNGCADKSLAEFHACLHLGTNLLSSSFSPAALSARLLEQAFNMNPAVEVLVNLCAALAVAEEWEVARQCLTHLDGLSAPQAAPAIPVLRQALERRNSQLARHVGLFRLNPSQSELLRQEKDRQSVYSLTSN